MKRSKGATGALAAAVVAAAAAAALVTVGSCGAYGGRVSSPVADRPAAYSEDARLDEIDRLDARIASEMSTLGLSRSDAEEHTVVTADVPPIAHEPEPDGDRDGVEASAPPSPVSTGSHSKAERAERSWCERVCDSTHAICEAADKICRIADSLPGHPTARDRCTRARNDCSAARDGSSARSCGCGS
jgi:hypothetical protein